MLRLVAYAPDGVRRFPIGRSELLIGSQPRCDIYLPYTGVARAHARLRFDGGALRIEDLGSRKGVLVSGRRVRDAVLEELDEVRLGSVTLLVEEVVPEERPPPAPAAEPPVEREPQISPERMLEHMARISNWVLADPESRTPLEALVGELLADFGGGALFLLHGKPDEEAGIKFVTATDPAWLAAGEGLLAQVREQAARRTGDRLPGGELVGELGGKPSWISHRAFSAVDRPYLLIVALPRYDGGGWSPAAALGTLGQVLVLGLVHHLGWYEPILPGRRSQPDLTLDPRVVVGESAAMKRAIEQLRRAAVDAEATVLLRGAAGVGKELLAHSLHLSSPRREGPFITASCAGAPEAVIEADLFGAEVAGRGAPVERQGKLLLADGGTLFLADVEELPLELQARLVRFLRSGEVEPAGSRSATRVDVRLIAASRGPLEPYVARDAFRVDLAYRLSRFAIDVPPLRARREDLPLLIQAAINRYCHDTGKRMQGITVKAMSALLAYDYPGNLTELDNIARQMVYLCPPGKPIDANLLPERVRLAPVQADAHIDATSELSLDRLVAATERAAIREALRRTHGNKSQAARLLGLSRNGLANKMRRFGLG